MLSEGWPISWCHEATTVQSTAYRHVSATGGVSIDSKRSRAACAPSSRPDSPEARALARVEGRFSRCCSWIQKFPWAPNGGRVRLHLVQALLCPRVEYYAAV